MRWARPVPRQRLRTFSSKVRTAVPDRLRSGISRPGERLDVISSKSKMRLTAGAGALLLAAGGIVAGRNRAHRLGHPVRAQ